MKRLFPSIFVLAFSVILNACCDATVCQNYAQAHPVIDTVYADTLILMSVEEEPILWQQDSTDYIQTDSCNGGVFQYDHFDIKILEYDDLTYVEHDGLFTTRSNYDINGVPMFYYQGKFSYHPIEMAQYALQMLDVYHDTKNELLLDQIKVIVDKLEAIGLHMKDASFYPYSFSFSLHGIEEETMEAPWCSGMAQGQILSLYCRLYEETGEKRYLNLSHRVFRSFYPLKGKGEYPWVSCIDKHGNLWIEEYPEDVPAFTLNGMNFAMYGIYDYYRVTKNNKAKILLMATLTTIKKNIEHFRREGGMSVYCLKHNIRSEYYHEVHIDQLHDFYLITGDEYFEKYSNLFKEDFVRDYLK